MAVDLRCPGQHGRLLAKVNAPRIVDGNLIEIACRDCARSYDARQVLHRFNVLGELVETETIPK